MEQPLWPVRLEEITGSGQLVLQIGNDPPGH